MTLKRLKQEDQDFIRGLFKKVGKELPPFRIDRIDRPYNPHCYSCSCRHNFGYRSYCVRGEECKSEGERKDI